MYNKQQSEKAKQQFVGTWVATSPSDFSGLKFIIRENGTCNFVSNGNWYYDSNFGTASCEINGEEATLKISNGKLVYTATAFGKTVSVYFKKN